MLGAQACGGMWLRDNEGSDVAGTEFLAVTSQSSRLTLTTKGYHVSVEVVLFLQAVQTYLDFFS